MEEHYSSVRVRATGEWVKVRRSSFASLENLDSIIDKWQNWLTLITRIASVPSALIMKLNEDTLEVFLKSNAEGNPYNSGKKAELGLGLYCETVIGTREKLLIPDATKSPIWNSNPDIELDMISYLGFPINWPDGEVFGTICILDNKENHYSDIIERFISELQNNLENDLAFLVSRKMLRDSEERFRLLYFNMAEGSALHNLVYDDQGVPEDYRIIEVNHAFETQLGISRDAVINKTSREAYGVDYPPYFEIYSRVALTGKPEVFQTYFAPLDKHFSISVYCPYKGSFATIFEDITEREKAEQALNIILTKYQILFEIFPMGITITDTTGKIIESNKVAETLLGITLQEQEKRKIDGLEWRIIRPDGTIMPPSEFASVRALEQNRPITNVEMGIVKARNRVTWLNVSATPIPIEGYGVAIVYSDITQRKLLEIQKERTQKLLEDSQRMGKIGGWEINIDTLELKWTREMYNIHEVDSSFVPKVDHRAHFYTPESLPPIDEAVRRAIEFGESYEVDSEIITAKGNRRFVKAIGNADLEHRRVFGFFQDITERKKVEEVLKKNEAQLQELNATKDKFFSIIAHDLLSPFNTILGFSDMLKREVHNLDNNLIEKYLEIINSSAQNTHRLLENLLDWSRMQQGGIQFEPKAVLLNSLIKSEIENLKYNADQKNITLVNNTQDEIMITADEKMVGTVLRNLISNAIKFTPRGGIIRVETKMNTGHFEVSISDTGVGIKKENIENLFKIETSFTTRGTEKEKGSGLGLLLCKEFVEKHGGEIWAESEPGEGSRFTFSIPSL